MGKFWGFAQLSFDDSNPCSYTFFFKKGTRLNWRAKSSRKAVAAVKKGQIFKPTIWGSWKCMKANVMSLQTHGPYEYHYSNLPYERYMFTLPLNKIKAVFFRSKSKRKGTMKPAAALLYPKLSLASHSSTLHPVIDITSYPPPKNGELSKVGSQVVRVFSTTSTDR